MDISRWNGVLPANFVNGTDGIVLDADAVPQVVRSAADVQITVNARAGLTYQLQRATSLTAPDWTNLSGQPQAATTNAPLTLTDVDPTSTAQGFYRVVISQTPRNTGH